MSNVYGLKIRCVTRSVQELRQTVKHQCHFSSSYSASSFPQVEASIQDAVRNKAYKDLPELVSSLKDSWKQKNPFLFLSSLANSDDTNTIVDEILQSFVPLRPRSLAAPAYACLLSYTLLHTSNPLPISLAVLQRTLRSGLFPVPQTHLHLSSTWLRQRHSHAVSTLLNQMNSLNYHPDCGTCNYLISSLCTVDQLPEAVQVLKSMDNAGCAPDSHTYGTIIDAMCSLGKTADAFLLMKEMVMHRKLTPPLGTMKKLTAALRSNKDCWRAVEVIEFLEQQGCHAGFQTYELVIEGCLESKEFVLAAKAVFKMTARGFIPYIRMRQKLIEGLISVRESELAYAVRHRFTELGS